MSGTRVVQIAVAGPENGTLVALTAEGELHTRRVDGIGGWVRGGFPEAPRESAWTDDDQALAEAATDALCTAGVPDACVREAHCSAIRALAAGDYPTARRGFQVVVDG